MRYFGIAFLTKIFYLSKNQQFAKKLAKLLYKNPPKLTSILVIFQNSRVLYQYYHPVKKEYGAELFDLWKIRHKT